MNFKILKSIKLILIFMLLLSSLSGGYLVSKSSFFNLVDIQINYTQTSNYVISLNERVLDVLDPYKNVPLWKIDLNKIESDLRNQSWIQAVSISRQFPTALKVEIQPKNIIANVVRSPSKIIPVAEDSQLLPLTNHQKAPDAPLLIGKEFLRNQSLRESALKLLRELPVEGSFSLQTVSEVFPRKNEFAIRIKDSKASILMNTENVSVKSARVSKVVDYLNERDLDGRVIDTNFSKKVLVRLRNDR